ncbi:MAG: DUF4837 family protein, partial [Gemmatimonadota bacterium]
ALAACGEPQAWGEDNSLIIVAPDSLWAQVEDTTRAVLEPTIFTTRDENQYNVTHIDPTAEAFADLRVFRNVIVSGTADDPLIREVAEEAGIDLSDAPLPFVFQGPDVWARGQTVTGVVLRGASRVQSWMQALPAVLATVDASYRARVRARMFATPADTTLARELAGRFGFSILVPEVYDRVFRGDASGDTVVILRNDNPDPSELIRSILIQRRPALDSLTVERALAWRAGIDSVHYNVPQAIDTTRSAVTRFQIDGRPSLEVTGVWEDEGGAVPAAGPFFVWLVDCPSGAYHIDAWLYAPGESKYEYALQLQEILGSFRCAGDGA